MGSTIAIVVLIVLVLLIVVRNIYVAVSYTHLTLPTN